MVAEIKPKYVSVAIVLRAFLAQCRPVDVWGVILKYVTNLGDMSAPRANLAFPASLGLRPHLWVRGGAIPLSIVLQRLSAWKSAQATLGLGSAQGVGLL